MESIKNGSQRVLIVEQDPSFALTLQGQLEDLGWSVDRARSLQEAKARIELGDSFDLLLADSGTSAEEDPPELLQDAFPANLRLILMTPAPTDLAGRRLRIPDGEVLPKPFNLRELRNRIDSVMADQPLSQEALPGVPHTLTLIAQSQPMQKIQQVLSKLARSSAPVLITGETGTGKEHVARLIHLKSGRAGGPFAVLHCGSMPAAFLEDDLFGHMAGTLTDVSTDHPGKLESAAGGTLFIDEIGCLPFELQSKFLNVLDRREFQRLGSQERVKFDVRIIASSQDDLRERTRQESFRQDLYYRLNVLSLHLPPLRERAEDIQPLAEHFLRIFSLEYSLPPKEFGQDALEYLRSFSWPGNVRELRNAIEFAAVLSGSQQQILPEDFPAFLGADGPPPESGFSGVSLPDAGVDLNRLIGETEKDLIVQALERSDGNRGAAARLLGLKRTTLVEKLRRMNLL